MNEGKPMNNEAETRAQLWELIKDIKFAMFTNRSRNGHLHSRPMTTQNRLLDADDRLWFFMSRERDPVADLAVAADVNVSYADPDKGRYVSVTGTASVNHDPARARELWSKLNEAWFPGGADDPDVALVEVRILHAHYWDVKDSKITQLFKLARAAVTGKPVTDLGESAEVRMR